MRFSTGSQCVAAVAVALVLIQVAAPAGAQIATSAHSPRWAMTIEAAALRHMGGAVGSYVPGVNLGQTGATAAVGIARLTERGAGIRLSIRWLGLPDISHDPVTPPITDSGIDPGSHVQLAYPNGSFAAIGPSIDLASGIASEGLPLGIEIGPDAFRTLTRPREFPTDASPRNATLLGVHTTIVLAPGRRSNWHVTGGAQWLSGNIVTWIFPFGARYSF
ncbi:MAG TPA: hypothetical protein VGM67_16330 [Gemmatimonadaceae bacterium]|jgi:hypothetical protein